MSDDTRDIWEKITDPYLVGGAALGGLAGRAAGKRASRSLRGEASRYSDDAEELQTIGDQRQRSAWGDEKRRRREDRAGLDPGEYRAQDAEAQEYYEGAGRLRDSAAQTFSRAMNAGNMGTIAGAAAGYATGGAAKRKMKK